MSRASEALKFPSLKRSARSTRSGHLTGKQTIAEWAENAEIIEVLRGLGVDYAQGYGVSQPQKVQRAAIA